MSRRGGAWKVHTRRGTRRRWRGRRGGHWGVCGWTWWRNGSWCKGWLWGCVRRHGRRRHRRGGGGRSRMVQRWCRRRGASSAMIEVNALEADRRGVTDRGVLAVCELVDAGASRIRKTKLGNSLHLVVGEQFEPEREAPRVAVVALCSFQSKDGTGGDGRRRWLRGRRRRMRGLDGVAQRAVQNVDRRPGVGDHGGVCYRRRPQVVDVDRRAGVLIEVAEGKHAVYVRRVEEGRSNTYRIARALRVAQVGKRAER